jgi:hypothetical protein
MIKMEGYQMIMMSSDGLHGPCMIAPKSFGLDELGWVGLRGKGGRGKCKEK